MIAAPDQKCITNGCVAKQFKHGLCIKCYGQAKKLVESGRTTWEKLIKMGMAQSEQESGFLAEFERRERLGLKTKKD